MVTRPHPETPISQSNNIVDISNVGLKQFWNLKSHMQDASVLATAHYPETLDRIFIVGAPGFFPTVWGWVKRWFDPITVSKIFILSPANVYATLSEYIDHDNIPKKYGGGLEFEWTQMPNLEPEIEAAIKWENPGLENGRKTLPTGPVKWEKGPNGEMQAWAVGNQNGKPRRNLVFTIPNPVGYRTKPVVNTPAHELGDPLTTVGTATHPPDVDDSNIDQSPPSDSPSPSETSKSPDAAATALAPSSTPAQTELPIREGTSEARYEQQNVTHASGQLASGTPQAAVNDHGHGDKTVTMEPNTIGQAPKQMPLPVEPIEAPAPTYLEQAQNAAAQASGYVASTVSSVAGAVSGAVSGASPPKEEQEAEPVRTKSPAEQQLDQQIDASKDLNVEVFLRAQNRSQA